jgi:hypothetical protein
VGAACQVQLLAVRTYRCHMRMLCYEGPFGRALAVPKTAVAVATLK